MMKDEIESRMAAQAPVQRQESPAGVSVGELIRMPPVRDVVTDAQREAVREKLRNEHLSERLRKLVETRKVLGTRIHARLLGALRKMRTPCALLLGPTGTGKTSAMHWIAAEFCGSFIHARELGSCERRHGLGEGYPPELVMARSERVLFLDDVGAEDPRDLSTLQYAIDCRYRNGLATVATSGLTPAELSRHLGAPYVRRLTEQHVARKSGDEWPVLLVDLFQG